MDTVCNRNLFQSLRDFTAACRADKRITPHTQLVYRVLIDLANCAYWASPFEASDSDLKAITHINSNATINACKRTLKNLGYIDYFGKPTRYVVYSPVVHQVVNQAVDSAVPPDPPGVKHSNTNTNTSKKEMRKKESEEPRHDANDATSESAAANTNDGHKLHPPKRHTEVAAPTKERINALLQHYGYRRSNH